MINDKWKKEIKNMGDDKDERDIAVIGQRLNEHDVRLSKIEDGLEALQELKVNVAILVAKFANFQPNCPLHQLRMDSYDARLVKVETSVENLWKKILVWSGVVSTILFIIAQLVIPYFLNHYTLAPNEQGTEQRVR